MVDAAARPDHDAEEAQRRELPDGTTWQVLKRYFTPESLGGELARSETLHAGPWFVMVRSAS